MNPFTFSITVMNLQEMVEGESEKDLSAIVYKTIESFHTFFYSYELTRDGQGWKRKRCIDYLRQLNPFASNPRGSLSMIIYTFSFFIDTYR